jgi:hypothetical protein
MAIGPSGHFFVSSDAANRVDEFGADGSFLRAFGAGVLDGADAFQVCTPSTECQAGRQTEDGRGFSRPGGIAVGADGTVYVSEAELGVVKAFRSVEVPAPPPDPPGGGGCPLKAVELRFGRVIVNPSKGTATLEVVVSCPGRVVLSGRGVRRASATAKEAGSVRLPVRLAGNARSILMRNGRSKVQLIVTFSPTQGTRATKHKPLTLRKKR